MRTTALFNPAQTDDCLILLFGARNIDSTLMSYDDSAFSLTAVETCAEASIPTFTPSIEPGIIDVLIPSWSTSSSLSSSKRLDPNPILCTRSYSFGHYDRQRPILIPCPAKPITEYNFNPPTSSSTSHKISVQKNRELSFSGVADASAHSFQAYIQHSKPVKIAHFMSFRNVENHDAPFLTPVVDSMSPISKNTNDKNGDQHDVDSLLQKLNFPLHILDAEVDVLCHVPNLSNVTNQCKNTFPITEDSNAKKRPFRESSYGEKTCHHPRNDTQDKFRRTNQKEISSQSNPPYESKLHFHHQLSVVSPHYSQSEPTPVYLGQEDEITMKMTLRQVFDDSFHTPMRTNSTNSSTLQVYVAQQSILSSRDSDSHPVIVCHPNGTLTSSMESSLSHVPSSNDPPLHVLTPYLRVPSFLLPSHMAHILEVNFWYAPRASCTNYHYDSNHNLLMVLSGTKTVELTPPDTIRPLGIYSNHPNHPRLLSRKRQRTQHLAANTCNTQCEMIQNRNDYDCTSDITEDTDPTECDETRRKLFESTFVVSISAGEALFIPEGWWHRVESESKCMAINIWFDHPIYSVVSSYMDKKHTLSYQVREMTRTLFLDQLDPIAKRLLMEDKNKFIHRVRGTSSFKIVHDMEQMMSSCNLTVDEALGKVVDSISSTIDADLNALSLRWKFFLFQIDTTKSLHRFLVLQLLDSILSSCKCNGIHWDEFLQSMESSHCYQLTQVWERHSIEDNAYVERISNSFFSQSNEDTAQCIGHFTDRSEEFKQRIAMIIARRILQIC